MVGFPSEKSKIEGWSRPPSVFDKCQKLEKFQKYFRIVQNDSLKLPNASTSSSDVSRGFLESFGHHIKLLHFLHLQATPKINVTHSNLTENSFLDVRADRYRDFQNLKERRMLAGLWCVPLHEWEKLNNSGFLESAHHCVCSWSVLTAFLWIYKI